MILLSERQRTQILHEGHYNAHVGNGRVQFSEGVSLLLLQGTDKNEQHLNIFLEFVPGGSIASLLAKFGTPSAMTFDCRR